MGRSLYLGSMIRGMPISWSQASFIKQDASLCTQGYVCISSCTRCYNVDLKRLGLFPFFIKRRMGTIPDFLYTMMEPASLGKPEM